MLVPTHYAVEVDGAPLPERLVHALREIEVETSAEKAAAFRLHFDLGWSSNSDWDVLEEELFKPLTKVKVSVNLGTLPEVLINGYVYSMDLDNRSEPGRSRLEVEGMDIGATLMMLEDKSRAWPNLADSAIVEKIFKNHGLELKEVEATPQSRAESRTTTVQKDTDFAFIKFLAARYGYEAFVEPHELLGRDVGHFHRPRLDAAPQGVLSVNFGAATNLEGFSLGDAMLEPSSAQVAMVDTSNRQVVKALAATSKEASMGQQPTLARLKPLKTIRPSGLEAVNATEIQAQAQSIADRSSRSLRGRGQVDGLKYGRLLRPARPVLVRGIGKQYSGSYYVTAVHHSISQGGHFQRFEAWRNAIGLKGDEDFVDFQLALSIGF